MNDFWAERRQNLRLEEQQDQLDALAHANASARAASRRLTSQLATLQGSLETRLNALSVAFDAYVELGDLREQLVAFGDTAAIRREVKAAVDALSDGRPVEPIEVVDPSSGESDYWLPHAANAVIALAQGSQDPAAEERARGLERAADQFIIAAMGALGKGEAVADRVPQVLVCDGALNEVQYAIWQGIVEGVYGDVIGAVVPVWTDQLAQVGDPAEWRSWVADQAKSGVPSMALGWLDSTVRGPGIGTPATPEQPATEADQAPPELPEVVTQLIDEGTGAERDLLARARLLREVIEQPELKQTLDTPPEPPRMPIATVVRDAYAASTDPATRSALLTAMGPGLVAATEAYKAEVLSSSPVSKEVNTSGGRVLVTTDGASPQRLSVVERNIREVNAPQQQKLIGWAVATGVLAVLALIVAIVGSPALAVTLLIGAVIAAIVTVLQVRDRGQRFIQLETDLTGLQTAVGQGTTEVRAAEQSRVQERDSLVRLADRVIAGLHAGVPS